MTEEQDWTRECDRCGARITEGYNDLDGGAYCSLRCADWTEEDYAAEWQPRESGGEPRIWWTQWEERA